MDSIPFWECIFYKKAPPFQPNIMLPDLEGQSRSLIYFTTVGLASVYKKNLGVYKTTCQSIIHERKQQQPKMDKLDTHKFCIKCESSR